MSHVHELTTTSTNLVHEISKMPTPAVDGPANSAWQPPFQVVTTAKGMTAYVDLPGVIAKNVHVDCQDGRLWIWGYRALPGNDQLCNRPSGTFSVDAPIAEWLEPKRILTKLADGVLTISIPKRRESIHR